MLSLIICMAAVGFGGAMAVISKSSSLRFLALVAAVIGATQGVAGRYREHPFVPLVKDLKPGFIIRVDYIGRGRVDNYSVVGRFDDGPVEKTMLMQTLGYDVKEGACYKVVEEVDTHTQGLLETTCPNGY